MAAPPQTVPLLAVASLEGPGMGAVVNTVFDIWDSIQLARTPPLIPASAPRERTAPSAVAASPSSPRPVLGTGKLRAVHVGVAHTPHPEAFAPPCTPFLPLPEFPLWAPQWPIAVACALCTVTPWESNDPTQGSPKKTFGKYRYLYYDS